MVFFYGLDPNGKPYNLDITNPSTNKTYHTLTQLWNTRGNITYYATFINVDVFGEDPEPPAEDPGDDESWGYTVTCLVSTGIKNIRVTANGSYKGEFASGWSGWDYMVNYTHYYAGPVQFVAYCELGYEFDYWELVSGGYPGVYYDWVLQDDVYVPIFKGENPDFIYDHAFDSGSVYGPFTMRAHAKLIQTEIHLSTACIDENTGELLLNNNIGGGVSFMPVNIERH